jgi:hypothetical protein
MDYVYGVLPGRSRGEEELLVLPEDRAEELAEIRDLLRSRTWGELRRKASPGRYQELLSRLGYGEFAELAAELNIGAGVRGALEMALAEFDPHAVPPGDGEPFDANEVAGDSAGEYPPDPHHLQNLVVAPEIVDRWGERYQGSHQLSCVMLRADGLKEIINSLEAGGHTCREDAELIRAGIGD